MRHRLPWAVAPLGFLFAALLSGAAVAQTSPPPAATLPDLDALPRAGDTRLPGIDARHCGTTRYSALCAAGRWAQFSSIDVRLTAPSGFTGDYTLEQAADGDVHATYRETGGAKRGGEVVLIGAEGIAYRTRDALPDPDSVIDYMLSNPLMQSKLVAVLLDLGVLGPPSDVTRPQAITASSTTQYLRAEAPRMALLFAPPWTMRGTVRPAGDGKIAFALKLRYRPVDRNGMPVAGKTDGIELTGTVSYAPRRATLPDSLDLTGWKLMRRDTPLRGVETLGAARESLGP
ncbi:MAG: hypothetical protein U1F15_07495 [Burkholderiales bacterium]